MYGPRSRIKILLLPGFRRSSPHAPRVYIHSYVPPSLFKGIFGDEIYVRRILTRPDSAAKPPHVLRAHANVPLPLLREILSVNACRVCEMFVRQAKQNRESHGYGAVQYVESANFFLRVLKSFFCFIGVLRSTVSCDFSV